MSFTLPKEDGPKATEALDAAREGSGFDSLVYDDQIGRLSVVGAGMRTNAGVSAQLFTALSNSGINIEMISTSEIRISVIMRADILPKAVLAVHTAFGLDGDQEATVYAGTGR
jgi:aspartate kinase